MAYVEAWRNKNESNARYFQHLKLIFERAAATTIKESFDTDEAWIKVREKLHGSHKIIDRKRDSPPYQFLMRIAAGIVLLLTVGIFSYKFFESDSIPFSEVVTDNKTLADTLPDGSGVFLNRQTKIEYSFDETKNTHTAKLVGEAYFNIQHDNDKTFIVEAEGTLIRDIGTSFNVKAYPGSSTVEVVVEEGEVMFYSEGDPGVYIKANGKGVYNNDNKTFTVADPEPNVTAYKTKYFSFNNRSLTTVVDNLNEVYDTRIQIDENLKNCRLTVSFNDEDIEEIAQVIAETLGLSVARSGDAILLKGTGCGEDQPQ